MAIAAAFDGLRRNAILLAETIEGMDLLEAQGGADEIVDQFPTAGATLPPWTAAVAADRQQRRQQELGHERQDRH